MKLEKFKTSPFDTNANLNSNNTSEFKIGDHSVVIEILRNRLYGNPIQTLVQEYLCNGRDANREAGNDSTPIQVTLPTYDSPVLKIRDFGMGISQDRMNNIFIYYGASTKRGTDNQTGGFGIGAKSAWAYTDNFIIITVLEGKAYHYAAYISNNNNGELTHLSTIDAPDSPNGTEVQVPIKSTDIEYFKKAVFRATMFWDVKPEILNDSSTTIPAWYSNSNPVVTVGNVKVFRPDDIGKYFNPSDSYNPGIVFVIDGIPYPLDSNFKAIPEVERLRKVFKDGRIITLHVGNGDVEVSASREKISDSEFSKKSIALACETAINELVSMKDKKIKAAKSLKEFLDSHRELSLQFNHSYESSYIENGVTYRLEQSGVLSSKISPFLDITGFKFESKNAGRRRRFRDSSENEKKKLVSSKTAILYAFDSVVLYNDCPNDGPYVVRDRVKSALKVYGKSSAYVLGTSPVDKDGTHLMPFTDENVKEFVKAMGGVFLSEIARPVKERVKKVTATKDKSGSDQGHNIVNELYIHRFIKENDRDSSNNYVLDLDNIDSSVKFVFVSKVNNKVESKLTEDQLKELAGFLSKYNYILCAMTPRSQRKVTKNDNFIQLESFLDNLDYKVCHDVIVAGKVRAVEFAYSNLVYFVEAKVDQLISDPEVKSFISDAKFLMSDALSRRINTHVPEVIKSRVLKGNQEVEQEVEKFEKFFKEYKANYPALGIIPGYQLRGELAKEMVVYMNAKYAERKGEK